MESNSQIKIIEITTAIQKLLLEKNKRYGDAALNPSNVFSKESNVNSICIRIDDKINRVKESKEIRTNDVTDLIGYLTLLLIAKNVTKEDILKLID